jgi:hypothetical protein
MSRQAAPKLDRWTRARILMAARSYCMLTAPPVLVAVAIATWGEWGLTRLAESVRKQLSPLTDDLDDDQILCVLAEEEIKSHGL